MKRSQKLECFYCLILFFVLNCCQSLTPFVLRWGNSKLKKAFPVSVCHRPQRQTTFFFFFPDPIRGKKNSVWQTENVTQQRTAGTSGNEAKLAAEAANICLIALFSVVLFRHTSHKHHDPASATDCSVFTPGNGSSFLSTAFFLTSQKKEIKRLMRTNQNLPWRVWQNVWCGNVECLEWDVCSTAVRLIVAMVLLLMRRSACWLVVCKCYCGCRGIYTCGHRVRDKFPRVDYIVLYHTIPHRIVSYCIVSYCIRLYCTIAQCV